ncbi:hypothetical protein Hanom_Chr07g00611891 [Helianthus anomalus]
MIRRYPCASIFPRLHAQSTIFEEKVMHTCLQSHHRLTQTTSILSKLTFYCQQLCKCFTQTGAYKVLNRNPTRYTSSTTLNL